MKSYSAGKKGEYNYCLLENHPTSFINFIVIKYKNGDEELIIGWAITKKRGHEQAAYKIIDIRVIEYFKSYHGDLYQ